MVSPCRKLILILSIWVSSCAAQTILQDGLQSLQRGNLVQARSALERASKEDPSNPITWSALAEVYFRSHEPALASSAAQTAERKSAGDPLVMHALAMYYSEAGDFAKAARLEGQFAHSVKADPRALKRTVDFYLKANQPEDALPFAERAAQSDPGTAFALAQAFLQRQDFTPAADLLQSGLERFPNDPQLTLALGVARYGQRRFEDALDLFLRVIELDPVIDQPYSFIGRMLDQAGSRLPRIEGIFAKRAKDYPDDPRAQFLYAKVLLAANSKDPGAEALLRRSIALDNARWESHYELGALLASEHRFQEAETELSRSIELNPDQPNAHYQLARVYDRLGQSDRAKEEREIHRRLTSSSSSEKSGMQP